MTLDPVLNSLMDIAYGYMPIFDRMRECNQLLITKKICAQTYYIEFLQNVAGPDFGLEDFAEYFREIGKGRATTAPVLVAHPLMDRYYRPSVFRSDDLSSAAAVGSANHTNRSRTVKGDIIERSRSEFMKTKGSELYEILSSEFRSKARARLVEESLRRPIGPGELFSIDHRAGTFMDVSKRFLAPHGFYPSKKSLDFYEALDLDINDLYTLRWSIGDHDPFFWLSQTEPVCQPLLYLRSRKQKKRTRDAGRGDRFLEFPYERIVPGLRWAYSIACSDRELQVILEARLRVVLWALPEILKAIRAVLR